MKIAALLSVLLVLAACGDTTNAEPADPAAAWSGTIAYEAGVKLGGCDIGDLDPTRPGNEIAAVAADGGVHLIHHGADGWGGRQIAKAPAEMIQCAIGDADPTREGNELVVVGIAEGTEDSGAKGAAFLVYRDGDAWAMEPLFEDSALIHGVLIADVHPLHEGVEVVAIGFSKKAHILAKIDGAWQTLAALDLPGAGKTAAAVGPILAVANTSEKVALFRAVVSDAGDSVTWDEKFGPVGTSQGRIGAGAKLFLIACDDGSLQLVTPDGPDVIHKDTSKLRGAVYADIDPTAKGLEAATAGYGKTVTLLYAPVEPAKTWKALTLWRDTDKLHHLAGGKLPVESHGLALVTVGYSGRVIVCTRSKP